MCLITKILGIIQFFGFSVTPVATQFEAAQRAIIHFHMRAKTSLQGILVATAGLTIVVAFSADRPAPIYAESNVLLVTLDTLRADRLGTYGYLHGDTPHLDQLARTGIRFDQVISPMPMTLPAHTSLMTAR